jgi:hypothetical protein
MPKNYYISKSTRVVSFTFDWGAYAYACLQNYEYAFLSWSTRMRTVPSLSVTIHTRASQRKVSFSLFIIRDPTCTHGAGDIDFPLFNASYNGVIILLYFGALPLFFQMYINP